MFEMDFNPQSAANHHQPRAIRPATIPSAATVAYVAPANLHEIVFPSTESENTLIIPSVQRIATTYGIGAPCVIAMYAIATSNAIGTGKNAPTSAPITAPIIISGNATRNTYQKLFPYDPTTFIIACRQLSSIGISIGHV